MLRDEYHQTKQITKKNVKQTNRYQFREYMTQHVLMIDGTHRMKAESFCRASETREARQGFITNVRKRARQTEFVDEVTLYQLHKRFRKLKSKSK
jgi:Ni,Fe-hydrogenase I small subunit